MHQRVTTKNLVDHFTTSLNMDEVWLSNLCRYLRQDGILPTGAYKPGGAIPITPEQAGFVLLALLAADYAKGCTEFISKIREWRPARVQWGEDSRERAFLETVRPADYDTYFPAQSPDRNQTLGRIMAGIFDASISGCYPCLDISVAKTCEEKSSIRIDVTLAVAGHGPKEISEDPEHPSVAIVLSYTAPDQDLDSLNGIILTRGISKETIAKLSTLFRPIEAGTTAATANEVAAA